MCLKTFPDHLTRSHNAEVCAQRCSDQSTLRSGHFDRAFFCKKNAVADVFDVFFLESIIELRLYELFLESSPSKRE